MSRFLFLIPVITFIFLFIVNSYISDSFIWNNLISFKSPVNEQDLTTSCCKEKEVSSSSGNFIDNEFEAIFNNEPVDYPKELLAREDIKNLDETAVLGTKTSDGKEKWIEVSLAEQTLRAWEGDTKVMEFKISSGRWYPTPKGTYYIWYKTRRQKMSGGSRARGTYYYLPNVPHNMFFYKGYAVHGAYWHNNFGTPMSHGCVNAPLKEVATLFEWTGPIVPTNKNAVMAGSKNPGTKVYIH